MSVSQENVDKINDNILALLNDHRGEGEEGLSLEASSFPLSQKDKIQKDACNCGILAVQGVLHLLEKGVDGLENKMRQISPGKERSRILALFWRKAGYTESIVDVIVDADSVITSETQAADAGTETSAAKASAVKASVFASSAEKSVILSSSAAASAASLAAARAASDRPASAAGAEAPTSIQYHINYNVGNNVKNVTKVYISKDKDARSAVDDALRLPVTVQTKRKAARTNRLGESFAAPKLANDPARMQALRTDRAEKAKEEDAKQGRKRKKENGESYARSVLLNDPKFGYVPEQKITVPVLKDFLAFHNVKIKGQPKRDNLLDIVRHFDPDLAK